MRLSLIEELETKKEDKKFRWWYGTIVEVLLKKLTELDSRFIWHKDTATIKFYNLTGIHKALDIRRGQPWVYVEVAYRRGMANREVIKDCVVKLVKVTNQSESRVLRTFNLDTPNLEQKIIRACLKLIP